MIDVAEVPFSGRASASAVIQPQAVLQQRLEAI
jgi:hypothetical protein